MNTEFKNPRSVPHPNHGTEWLYYLSHRLWVRGHKRTAKIVKHVNSLIFRSFIDPQARIGKRLELPHGGFGVVINGNTVIGDDAIIFHNVTIANGGTIIGDRVYIGTGVAIIGSVTIGDDVIIGANTTVNFDIPSGATVVGPLGRFVVR